ncbi:Oidioi.mRNA.OKI2018_I69.chr1.g1549.t1.cds [Oikopleura dioica]|uniref:Oidioi.mRNA.OKI2018_I69.chr1.g1549.t1.cds n=1 Tax=Oikopleura dioica TaxID=34765 RepID=A0ABN7SS41_OIKDI|nr:Oidioi.mRNA.OKI2018_I69.chr1.g1549.t1.cds [Oikopleura dioica]
MNEDEIGFEFKDCKTVCQEDGCNDSRTNVEVLSEYSTGTVKSCRTCSETKIGAYNDLECENEETIDCPAYADTSCFTAAYTREFDGTYSHQLNKGCSSFKSNFEDSPTCFEINHNGYENYREETCKESCTEDNCNEAISLRPCLDNQICP